MVTGLALDIDETLSWTIGYWVEQMQKNFGNPEELTVREMISKYRYTQNVPYWQTVEAMAWIDERRNSNELQEVLPLIENANAIVDEINQIKPIALYLTTRPTSVMKGTKIWLGKHGFPDVEIIASPEEVPLVDGNQWKAAVLEKLYPFVEGIIDDNPGLVKCLSEDYKGTVFLYDNTETTRQDVNIIPCKTWSDVRNNVERQYS